MDVLQNEVLRREGFRVDPASPGTAKYRVAEAIGVPLKQGYNGELETKQTGKVGGIMGGLMVRELVRRAQQQLVESRK
jgi:hypothetical protein